VELVYAEHAAASEAGFGRWVADLHKPEVLVWSGPRQVPAVLEDHTADGTVILSVPDRRHLDAVQADGRLAMVYRADRDLFAKRLVPLFTTEYSVARSRGVVEARFTADPAADRLNTLPEPIAAALESSALFQRTLRATLIRLAAYRGEFTADDPGRCLVPGMVVTLTTWLPWTGALRLRAQICARRNEPGGVRYVFRMIDRESVETAAVLLVGTVDGFGFSALTSLGVKPSRMTRYLSIQTVSDEATFRRALEVRLAGNRTFGRLGAVDDVTELADRLDPHSVTILCLLGEKAVGTGRVVVNAGDHGLSEIEADTAGLPADVWHRGFVEVSRLAIHPDFRGSGVNIALFREIARLSFHLGCRYLVLDAIDKLVPAYQRIGATRLYLTKTHPYSKETVHVMAIDISEQLGRFGRRWLSWQYVFGPALKHHFSTSSPGALTGRVRGAHRIPLWFKRVLSRMQ
jgi:GNAT superfamily N-acetyltransferase